MSLMASRNTLRHQLARPLCTKREMGGISAQSTARAMRTLTDQYKNALVSPEAMAVRFYLLQHAMSDIRTRFGLDEPMGDAAPVVELHHSYGVELGQRMFTYLLLICTREARHTGTALPFHEKVVSKFGGPFQQFLAQIQGLHSDAAVEWFMSNPPDVELGTYTKGLEYVFRKGHFSGGYGGAGWADVAEVLNNFVNGTISAEMMLDIAFTLAHNGGPIFNKGMVFSMYDPTRLRMILDIQASGQIPHLISSVSAYIETNSMVSFEARQVFAECRKGLGDSFGGEIDWFRVAHGHLAAQHFYQYKGLKEKQTQLTGIPEWAVDAEAESAKSQLAKQAAHIKAKKKKIAADAEKQAILKAEHFTVGVGPPLKKEKRNG